MFLFCCGFNFVWLGFLYGCQHQHLVSQWKDENICPSFFIKLFWLSTLLESHQLRKKELNPCLWFDLFKSNESQWQKNNPYDLKFIFLHMNSPAFTESSSRSFPLILAEARPQRGESCDQNCLASAQLYRKVNCLPWTKASEVRLTRLVENIVIEYKPAYLSSAHIGQILIYLKMLIHL